MTKHDGANLLNDLVKVIPHDNGDLPDVAGSVTRSRAHKRVRWVKTDGIDLKMKGINRMRWMTR